MGDVVGLTPRPRFPKGVGCITITRSEAAPGMFEVRAWLGGTPSDPEADSMYCGARSSLLAAADLAREKSHDLGGLEIADFTSFEGPDDAPAA
jgi:hypothetical protein